MSELVLAGGRVIDETGERVADVRVVDGDDRRSRPRPRGLGRRARARRRRLRSSRPAWSTSRCTSAIPAGKTPRRIETGARAAALGGCTAVVCMPNTEPPLDDAAVVRSVLERGRQAACAVHVAGCITKGRRGEELSPMGELYDLGVRVFTDDGDCVADARVMRGAFEYLGALPGSVLSQHAEDPALVRGGHMHEGAWSARLGIPGRPVRGGVVDRGARPRARRAHRRPLPRAARLERGRRSSSCARPRPTACASPPSARRSTSCSPMPRARASTPCSR